MATVTATLPKTQGGAFLIEDRTPAEIFTPEDLTDEHRAIARTAEEFWRKEVDPNLEDIQQQKPGMAVSVLRKAAELGLTEVEPRSYLSMLLGARQQQGPRPVASDGRPPAER